MIKSFIHKGLERFFLNGSKSRIQPIHAPRLRVLLALLDKASRIEDMNTPATRLHALKGDMTGIWSVTVQANWRVTFRFDKGDIDIVDYLDYH